MVYPKDAAWYKRIFLTRINKGQKQNEVAEIIGTSRKQIYRLEHGLCVPTEYTRKKVSEWAGVSESVLFKGCPKP